jgi:hypothetical protein
MRTALAQRDIGRVYTLLTAAGISQYSIAWLTGQSQSEVSEMARRQLARAAEGWVPEGRADQATMDEARGGGDRAPSTPGPAQTPGSWPVWPAASPPPGHSRNPPGESVRRPAPAVSDAVSANQWDWPRLVTTGSRCGWRSTGRRRCGTAPSSASHFAWT